MKNIKEEAERLAKWFHNQYEDEAIRNGWATQKDCKVPFDELPEANRKTMIAVCEKLNLKASERLEKVEAQLNEAVEFGFDNGMLWGETYGGWFTPTEEDNLEKKKESVKDFLTKLKDQ